MKRAEVSMMLSEWKEMNLRAAGATCPMPNCGALAVSYESSDSLNSIIRQHGSDRWDFVCPECAAEFTAPGSDLLFQAVPREWLYSNVCHA